MGATNKIAAMNNFETIRRRLAGEMSPEEAAAFDLRLQEDEALAREYAQQRAEELLLDLAAQRDLQAKIKAIRQAQQAEKPSAGPQPEAKTIGIGWRWAWRAAAGLALLIGAYAIIQFIIPGKPSHLALAQAAYAAQPPSFSEVRAIDPTLEQQALEREKKRLLSGSPEEVKAAVAALAPQAAAEPAIAYWLGHGYWRIEDYDQAAERFRFFLEQAAEDADLRPNAEYYYALALLASGEPLAAKALLEDKKAGHRFEKQMEGLLRQL
jgi:hypothetical protein